MEAKFFCNPSAVALVFIPNHPARTTLTVLPGNYNFVSWITWRCYKKHGFFATSALVNTVLRLRGNTGIGK